MHACHFLWRLDLWLNVSNVLDMADIPDNLWTYYEI